MAACDEADLLPLDEALARLASAIQAPDWEGIRADRDDPALDRSGMDGIALRACDGRAPRRVIGTLYAGDDPSTFSLTENTCVRIMTGACLPCFADAIVPIEQVIEEGDALRPTLEPCTGDHVRSRASQAKSGDLLLNESTPVNAARMGLRAQVGLAVLPLRRVRVGIASTGDELASEPLPHQIRDSNGPMLEALAHRLGAEPTRMHSLPDDLDTLKSRLHALQDVDVLLTSGGVSVGERDLLPQALRELGATILFHKIRLKPGKPMLAALLNGKVILGLPGNPASAYLNALLFLPVALSRLQGATHSDPWKRGELLAPVRNPGNRPLLHPCALKGDQLSPLDSKGSGDLVRLAQADACVWIPEGGTKAGLVRYLMLI
jgi:molybdopterin molybdotransferase